MKVKVTKENVCITECAVVNESEINVNLCEFLLPECFRGLTVTALFNNIPVPLTGTQCYIPSLKSGTAVLGVYAYKESEAGDMTLMYSPRPACFYVNKGSYSEKISCEELPEISEFERYCATVNALTFPKSDVICELGIEKDFTQTQVYSANTVNTALSEVSRLLDGCYDEINSLSSSAEKLSNKTTVVDKSSTDAQYPSACAVYKGLCEQREQLRSALEGDVQGITESVKKLEGDLTAEINRAHSRADEADNRLERAFSVQSEMGERISALQENLLSLTVRADGLDNAIQSNDADISRLNEEAEAIHGELEQLNSSIEDIRQMINNSITDNANAVKRTVVSTGCVEISDVSPLTHYLDITVSGENAGNSVIECRGKNILAFDGRALADYDAVGHGFTGNNVYLSVSGSGYYKKNVGSWSYDENTHTYTVPCVNAWYGPGIDFKVAPGETYVTSFENISQDFELQAAFYDGDGNHITYSALSNGKSFTVPSGAEWMIVIFTSRTKGATGEFICPQIERGAVATAFEPAKEVQVASVGASGKITHFKSLSPTVVISSHNNNVNISCTYNRDMQSVYDALVNAIEGVGGSVG